MYRRSQQVKCWQVTELNSYLKDLLTRNPLLANLWVKGEISNFRQPSSGHLYFTLKDRSGSMRAVMFRSRAAKLPVALRDGMEVLVRASLSIYERDGVYQLYVEEVQPLGAGDLHKAFEALKQQLQAEGLFSSERKKPLPRLPKGIGIVTSLTGAALQDILIILTRRFPKLNIIIAPAQVQGAGAAASIVAALGRLNRLSDVDVIIMGRGGGSLEEIWAFNTEEVARGIVASQIPIVSAVGHETDFTIADLVADLRAPTPTAAATLVVPEYQEEMAKLELLLVRACRTVGNAVTAGNRHLAHIIKYSLLNKPENLYQERWQYLDDVEKRLLQIQGKILNKYQSQLMTQTKKLDTLSPLKVLMRGFALCQDQRQHIVKSVRQMDKGDFLQIRLFDGNLECQVHEVIRDD